MATLPETHKQWRLASYPEGAPTEDNWTLSEAPVPEIGSNQILVRAIYLDVAPYMRGRISPQRNYAAGVKPGDVLTEVEGKPVADPTSMLNLIAALAPGRPAKMKLKRAGQDVDATITVGRRPKPQARSAE